jgi:stringent starvation protein B
MGSDEICFNGRFGGASMTVRIPIDAVLAVYARETGQGMIFADDESGPPPQPPEPTQPPTDRPPEPPQRPAGRAKLKVVK